MTDKQQAIAEARRIYFREWRRKNKDKVKRYNETYWRRKAEEMEKNKEADNDSATE